MLKKFIIAVAATSLAVSPVVAQSSRNPLAAPGSPIAPALFALIVALGILMATENWPFEKDEDDAPVSP